MIFLGQVRVTPSITSLNLPAPSFLLRDSTGEQIIRRHPMYSTPPGYHAPFQYLQKTEINTYNLVFGQSNYRVAEVAIFVPLPGSAEPIIWSGSFALAKKAFNYYAHESRSAGSPFTFTMHKYDMNAVETIHTSRHTFLKITRPNERLREIRVRGNDIELDGLYSMIRQSSTTPVKQLGIKIRGVSAGEVSIHINESGFLRLNDFQDEHMYGHPHPNLGDIWLHSLPLIKHFEPFLI